MDPNSSTFCVNYLSQFPLIKPETINTLCFNGFTNYHQLARLDESDLPFIRDISGVQKAAVKRALIRFAGHGNSKEWPGVTIGAAAGGGNRGECRSSSTDAVCSADSGAGSDIASESTTDDGSSSTTTTTTLANATGLVLNGGGNTSAAVRVQCKDGNSNGTIDAPNLFYESVRLEDSATAASATSPLVDGSSSTGDHIESRFDNSVSATTRSSNCQQVSASTTSSVIAVSTTTAAAAVVGTRSNSTTVVAHALAAASASATASSTTELILLGG